MNPRGRVVSDFSVAEMLVRYDPRRRAAIVEGLVDVGVWRAAAENEMRLVRRRLSWLARLGRDVGLTEREMGRLVGVSGVSIHNAIKRAG